MEILQLVIEATDNLAVIVLIAWVIAERRDKSTLWTSADALIKLRLRQISEQENDVFLELE